MIQGKEYLYLGDRMTKQNLKRKSCNGLMKNGKYIRGRNGSMLVRFSNGETHVIIGRLLRIIKTTQN